MSRLQEHSHGRWNQKHKERRNKPMKIFLATTIIYILFSVLTVAALGESIRCIEQ